MKILGFEIKRFRKPEEAIPAIASPLKDDGATVINAPSPNAAAGSSGIFLDLEGTVKNESELITKYRDMALHPEIDAAIDEIVNESIVTEDGEKTVQIVLDDVPVPDTTKKLIESEFDEVLRLLEFHRISYDVFRRWYIDGRLYYLVLFDPAAPSAGIRELRYLDPRKIRKIRQVKSTKDKNTNTVLTHVDKEYYIYADKALMSGPTAQLQNFTSTSTGVKIAKDAVVYVPSGMSNSNQTMVLSYLHKAIKPLNMLRSMEDSLVIYRISRAPERRIFYVDVGTMSHSKAEAYVASIMNSNKNMVVYNAQTGEIKDDRKFMTMIEDYYIPRREGGKGTEIDTLPAGQNLGQIEDIQYFQNKLYNSLNVPVTRLNPDDAFEIGRSTQISHDEVKFAKFIDRLRLRFSTVFLEVLERNLVLKRLMSGDEWDQIVHHIKFKYLMDNDFAELKDLEILQMRLTAAQLIDPYVGRYYSNTWVRKHVHRQSEDDIEENDDEIAEEVDNPQFLPPDMLMQMQDQEFQNQQAQQDASSQPKKNK
jgi:Bacteriophage T4-like capsid assembly protein (Gp20).